MTDVSRREALTLAAAASLGAGLPLGVGAEPAAAQSFGAAAAGPRPTLTLLLVNDIYKMSGVDGRGGFARLAAIARAERAKGVPLLYAHAGDMFSPSLMSGFDQGAHTVELLNVVPPDVFVPGNHEFDFGPDVYMRRRGESRFPYLAANLRGADGKPLQGHDDNRLLEAGPIKVGVFGVALATTPFMSQSGPLKFLDEMETVRTQAKLLRAAGADLVVAVTHTDFERDLEIMRSKLVDVLLTGHDHDLRLAYDNRVVMVESGEEGEYVTAIDIFAAVSQQDGRRKVTWRPRFRVIDSALVAPDPAAQKIVDRLEAELGRELDVAIGKAGVELDTRSATVRSQEAVFANIVADAIRLSTGADIGLTNGGALRGNRLYPAGHVITRRDVLSEMPFGNRTVMVEITGRDLKDALENGVSDLDNRGGRFPHVSGLTIVVNEKAKSGERVVAIERDGKPIDPAGKYKVASNDFMLAGGDGYSALARGRTLIGKTDGKLMASVVMSHIRSLGTIGARIEGRIVLR
ncbi:MAG TPA: bifunctional UDP-sugar hydrolase/5'-nucleotidase [Hyphomicrobiaceae bacterium]|nr:bifunctional UDP-sugar hydrolase/5'-nucleotidase [Hyphomicrobiaceae bacterium]